MHHIINLFYYVLNLMLVVNYGLGLESIPTFLGWKIKPRLGLNSWFHSFVELELEPR
jgi:hypothetical protein